MIEQSQKHADAIENITKNLLDIFSKEMNIHIESFESNLLLTTIATAQIMQIFSMAVIKATIDDITRITNSNEVANPLIKLMKFLFIAGLIPALELDNKTIEDVLSLCKVHGLMNTPTGVKH